MNSNETSKIYDKLVWDKEKKINKQEKEERKPILIR